MSEDLTTYENSDGHWVSEQEHRRIVAEKDREITKLREALTNLYALVEGECPSLLNEDSGGDARLAMQIEQAMKESP